MTDQITNEHSLADGEFHPSAPGAMLWIKMRVMLDPVRFSLVREAVASVALSGNRTAEICHSTLERLANGKPVSDRYVLGLAWFLREMIDGNGLPASAYQTPNIKKETQNEPKKQTLEQKSQEGSKRKKKKKHKK